MARTKNGGNGRLDRLEESMNKVWEAHAALAVAQSHLVQAQAALAQQHTLFLARMAEIDARIAKTDAQIAETSRINSERFARIEAILLEHSRILRALPDAVRDKIGFKNPPPPKTE
jgi:hypothetical protein